MTKPFEKAREEFIKLNNAPWFNTFKNEYIMWWDDDDKSVNPGWCEEEYINIESPNTRVVIPRNIALHLTEEDYNFYRTKLIKKVKEIKIKYKLERIEKDF